MNNLTLVRVIIGAVAAAVVATIAFKLFGDKASVLMAGAIGVGVGCAVVGVLAITGSGKKKE